MIDLIYAGVVFGVVVICGLAVRGCADLGAFNSAV